MNREPGGVIALAAIVVLIIGAAWFFWALLTLAAR